MATCLPINSAGKSENWPAAISFEARNFTRWRLPPFKAPWMQNLRFNRIQEKMRANY